MHVSIKAALGGMFGLVAVVAAGQGIVTVRSLSEMSHSIGEIGQTRLPAVNIVNQINTANRDHRVKLLPARDILRHRGRVRRAAPYDRGHRQRPSRRSGRDYVALTGRRTSAPVRPLLVSVEELSHRAADGDRPRRRGPPQRGGRDPARTRPAPVGHDCIGRPEEGRRAQQAAGRVCHCRDSRQGGFRDVGARRSPRGSSSCCR